MYTCFLVDCVLLSPVVGVIRSQSAPFEVNIENLVKNYNYLLKNNLKYVKIINKRSGKFLDIPHPY